MRCQISVQGARRTRQKSARACVPISRFIRNWFSLAAWPRLQSATSTTCIEPNASHMTPNGNFCRPSCTVPPAGVVCPFRLMRPSARGRRGGVSLVTRMRRQPYRSRLYRVEGGSRSRERSSRFWIPVLCARSTRLEGPWTRTQGPPGTWETKPRTG